MSIITTIRKIFAACIGMIGIAFILVAAWLGIDEEDWSESYDSRKTPVPRKE